MSTGKGFLAGIITSVAAYAAFKALPDDRQKDLKQKAKQAGDQISDTAIDLAYGATDAAGALKDKVSQSINQDVDHFKEQTKSFFDENELIRNLEDLEDDD